MSEVIDVDVLVEPESRASLVQRGLAMRVRTDHSLLHVFCNMSRWSYGCLIC